MNVYLLVKAKVPKNIVNEFDEWYQKYHLLEAHFSFKSLKAFRFWINDNEHHAYYKFKNIDIANNVINGKSLEKMVKIFDNKWQGQVTRTRVLIEIIQEV